MWHRRIRSFICALRGIRIAWLGEPNFRIEIACAAVAILAGVFFHISRGEWMVLVLCIAMVLAVETLNTALEALCDMVRDTHDPHVAIIKDLAAAAVLLVVLGSLVVGLCIFIPYLIAGNVVL